MEKNREHDRDETHAEQSSITAVFEATLIELAESDAVAIETSLRRLFTYTLGSSPDLASALAGMATDHLPRPRPVEYGVRVLKLAEITDHEREQLMLRVAAYVITAPDARFTPQEAFECSDLVINYAASLLRDQNPALDREACLRTALEDYIVILRNYLEQTVNLMADSHTADEYAERLTAATIISELESDLREVYSMSQGEAVTAS